MKPFAFLHLKTVLDQTLITNCFCGYILVPTFPVKVTNKNAYMTTTAAAFSKNPHSTADSGTTVTAKIGLTSKYRNNYNQTATTETTQTQTGKQSSAGFAFSSNKTLIVINTKDAFTKGLTTMAKFHLDNATNVTSGFQESANTNGSTTAPALNEPTRNSTELKPSTRSNSQMGLNS